ncbi:putative ceramidase [Helianthus anomalus]
MEVFGNLYNEDNVAISGTHTHAGPGGYLQYVVYSVTSLGFIPQSFDAIVTAIEMSILQAHKNLKSGSIFINTGAFVIYALIVVVRAVLENSGLGQTEKWTPNWADKQLFALSPICHLFNFKTFNCVLNFKKHLGLVGLNENQVYLFIWA